MPDDQVMAEHVGLMPELREELAKLALIRAAGDRAGEAGPDPNATASQLADGPTQPGDAATGGLPPMAEGPDIPSDAVPGYELVREISRGGQAVVYQAVQKSTGRKVAVKVLREGPFASAREKARFDREVQILVALDHPGIVSVIDRGVTVSGSYFLVMDYVSGRALDQHLADHRARHDGEPPEPGELLKLFLKICDAVNAAHLRGIVHCGHRPCSTGSSGVPALVASATNRRCPCHDVIAPSPARRSPDARPTKAATAATAGRARASQ